MIIECFNLHVVDIFKIYINDLFDSLSYWRVTKRHFHDEKFRKIVQSKYEVLKKKKTGKIINKSKEVEIIVVKWIFTYKIDSNKYLLKYKTRTVIKKNLQYNNVEDVYIAIFALKIFRVLMTLIAALKLQTR